MFNDKCCKKDVINFAKIEIVLLHERHKYIAGFNFFLILTI